MFQFSGFALKNLCIQFLSTCFSPLLITRGNNNKLSGGLPHSEIHGSKLILSSPWLIAEYHVFHRLLLPRHSPNALLALDLIQKKQDLRPARQRKLVRNRHLILNQKHTFPHSIKEPHVGEVPRKIEYLMSNPCGLLGLVYLTWTTLFVSAGRRMAGRGNNPVIRSHWTEVRRTKLRSSTYLWRSNSVDICISLYDVNSSNWTVKNCKQCLTVKSGYGGA